MASKAAYQQAAVAESARREEDEEYYPESDGLPMAQNDLEHCTICHAAEALRDHFRGRPDVHVRGDMLIYYERWDRSKSVVPDIFVVRGVGSVSRRSYKIWEEGKPPDFVMEIASPSTKKNDRVDKHRIYAKLGVGEFWRFDPTGETFRPPLAGRQLRGAQLGPRGYEPLRPNGPDSIRSEVLGLDVRVVDGDLRFWDPVKRRHLRTLEEAQSERRLAERERDSERRSRVAAQAELAELRARLEALQSGKD